MKKKIGTIFAIQIEPDDPQSLVRKVFKRAERKHGIKFGRRRKIETENQFGTKVTIYEATVVRLT